MPTALLIHLRAHEAARSLTDHELGEMEPRRLVKTASRSVLGVMHEFKYIAEVHAKLDDESDLLALSMQLAQTRRRAGPSTSGTSAGVASSPP